MSPKKEKQIRMRLMGGFFAVGALIVAGYLFYTPKDSVKQAKVKTLKIIPKDEARSAQFLINMTDMRRVVYEIAQLASRQGLLAEIRALGREIAKEQAAIIKDIELVAKEQNVVLPTELSIESSQELTWFRQQFGMNFDQAFFTLAVSHYESAANAFRIVATDSEGVHTSKVKEMAARQLQVLEKRVAALNGLEDKVRAYRAPPENNNLQTR